VARGHRQAEAAVKLRDEFLAIASHELRTPVTAMQLHIDGILMRSRRLTTTVPLPEWLMRKLAVRSQRLDLVRTLLDWGEAHGEHCNAAYAFLRFFGPVVCLLAPCWTGARRTVSWACNTVWRYMLLPSFVPKASGYGHGAC